jgi:hypothetical protein
MADAQENHPSESEAQAGVGARIDQVRDRGDGRQSWADRPERSVRDLCGYFHDCEVGTVRDPRRASRWPRASRS